MKYLTAGMEPARVLQFFEDICQIPHGSGNESALAHHIMHIAEASGLETEMDQHGNVLVRLVSSPGCESAPPFLMQAHMDMVCEKEDWCDLDMEKQPVRLRRDGNILYAEGSTLGADNAVGMCNMLAVMTDRELKHPEMEFLFTVREETGLEGIRLFDMTKLKSRKMMTMDCGDPDVLVLGSAGSLSYDLHMKLEREGFSGMCCELRVDGLHGGHTGLEIGNGYANALTMLAAVLAELEKTCGISLCSLEVGGGPGSIPDSGLAVISVPEAAEPEAKQIVARMAADFRSEFAITEPSMEWSFRGREKAERMLTPEACKAFLDFVLFAPSGPLKRHPNTASQVLGSALIKNARVQNGEFTGQYAIRSNTDPYKYELGNKFTRLCQRYAVSYERLDDSPAWPEKPESELTKICADVYERCFHCPPKQELVHGGEEASIVAYHIPEMEIVGYAPYSRGAHTPKERLHLDSMLPVWTFLTALLERLSETK